MTKLEAQKVERGKQPWSEQQERLLMAAQAVCSDAEGPEEIRINGGPKRELYTVDPDILEALKTVVQEISDDVVEVIKAEAAAPYGVCDSCDDRPPLDENGHCKDCGCSHKPKCMPRCGELFRGVRLGDTRAMLEKNERRCERPAGHHYAHRAGQIMWGGE